jgi:hypothetical protein
MDWLGGTVTTPADDLRALLDDLTAKHAAATDGPWFAWDRGVGWLITLDTDGGSNPLPEGFRTDIGREEDAALIVAAVNALPTLVARLRAAADLADQLAGPPTVAENGALRRQIADRLRAALRQDAP